MTDINIAHNNSQENPNTTAVLWRAGGNSQVHNVKISRFWAPTVSQVNKNHVHIAGHGGGHWSSTGSLGGNDDVKAGVHPLQRAILVENTSQPLRMYNVDPEDTHSALTDREAGAQFEIRNSQNVSVYSIKAENLNPLMINKSNNIFISNMGGQTNTRIYDSTNVRMLNNGPKFCFDNRRSGGLVIKENGQVKINLNPCAPFSVFNGQLDLDKFFPDQNQPTITTTPTPSQQPWDLNSDGSVNLFDFSWFANVFTTEYSFPSLTDFISIF